MKVAIGHKVRTGPWGGGNSFVANLTDALTAAGHAAVSSLDDADIDVILMTDPRARNPAVTFTPGAVLRHLTRRNSRALVVHRVNECDERKHTKTVNARLRLANYCADHTVFVGSWLLDLPAWRHQDRATCSVILNGADARTFNTNGHRPWGGDGPLKLVTHHWGGNWMKGFDIYQRLDDMLADPCWRDRIAFTYIGNLPRGFTFRNARYLPPMDAPALADELRTHHGYLTASINEPGGNHQNEGALCGLPLIYRDSGCLPEYCSGFGIEFTPETFEAALETMFADYPAQAEKVRAYPHTAEKTTARYLTLFEELIARREEILARRHLWRSPARFALNQLPL